MNQFRKRPNDSPQHHSWVSQALNFCLAEVCNKIDLKNLFVKVTNVLVLQSQIAKSKIVVVAASMAKKDDKEISSFKGKSTSLV